jgi:molybdopterin synthase sulfur carrier subunit
MKIELRLYASLTALLPDSCGGSPCDFEAPDGQTVNEVLESLKVPLDIPKIIFLNGVHAEGHEVLKAGDRLAVFPPIAGG